MLRPISIKPANTYNLRRSQILASHAQLYTFTRRGTSELLRTTPIGSDNRTDDEMGLKAGPIWTRSVMLDQWTSENREEIQM